MAISLPQIYSLSLNQATLDADHILLPLELTCLLPSQAELDLGDGGKIKVVRREEILVGRGLVRRTSRLGNLLEWSQNGDLTLSYLLVTVRRLLSHRSNVWIQITTPTSIINPILRERG